MTESDKDDRSDRRTQVRHALSLVVEYEGAEDLVTDYTENLSTGGTFIHTRRKFQTGAEVRVVLSFPGLLKPILIDGVVQWIRGEEDGEPGIGIKFKDYEDAVRTRLERIVAGIGRRDPGYVGRVVRILIVEDNPHVARLIRDGLDHAFSPEQGSGVALDFRHVANGKAALDSLRQEQFDAVICDVYLPEMDGPTLINRIRTQEEQRGIPIIAVSAGGAPAGKMAMEAGADFFIEKPMRLRHVVETLKQLVTLELD